MVYLIYVSHQILYCAYHVLFLDAKITSYTMSTITLPYRWWFIWPRTTFTLYVLCEETGHLTATYLYRHLWKKEERGKSIEYVTTVDNVDIQSSHIFKDNKYVTLISSLAGMHSETSLKRYDRKLKKKI